MIVRRGRDVLHLITQPDHAHLSRRIIERCVPLANRARRDAILHATAEHDNGWAEEDATPSVDPRTGDVVDFITAPLAVRHAVWPRGVARLAADPVAAALVAQHAITVYDRFRPDAAWSSFFAAMEASRNAMLEACRLPLEELLADYPFVRLADLISLVFCTGTSDTLGFGDWMVHLSGPGVIVRPDPFGGATIPIEIEAAELPARKFGSNAELHAALAVARTTRLRGEVVGRPGG